MRRVAGCVLLAAWALAGQSLRLPSFEKQTLPNGDPDLDVYGDSPRFARGHITRREDPIWGQDETIRKLGNRDSMHYTNVAPQMQTFNGDVWLKLEDYRQKLAASGEFQEKRQSQRWKAMWSALQDRLMTDLRAHPRVVAELPRIRDDLHDGRLTVTLAVGGLPALSRG